MLQVLHERRPELDRHAQSLPALGHFQRYGKRRNGGGPDGDNRDTADDPEEIEDQQIGDLNARLDERRINTQFHSGSLLYIV